VEANLEKEDAISRLKNRQRVAVPPRDASVANTIKLNDAKTEMSHSLAAPVAAVDESPEVIRSTVRLEEPIDSGLRSLCNQYKITKETFLEAAYLMAMEEPSTKERIVALAKSHYQKRKKISEYRKFQTLQAKLTESS
jgi:transposase